MFSKLRCSLPKPSLSGLRRGSVAFTSHRPLSSINSSFASAVNNSPDHIAMMHDDLSITYSELDENVNKLCAKFLNEYNLKKGDRLLHMSDMRIDGTQIMLACLKLGLVHVPLYPQLTLSQFEKVAKLSEPALVISESAYVKNALDCGLESKLFVLDEEFDPNNWLGREQSVSDASEINAMSSETVNNDDISCILFTSGTTGDPKGCVHTHESIYHNSMFIPDYENACYKVGKLSTPFVGADVALSLVPQHGIASLLGRLMKLMDSKTVLLPNTQNFRFAQHWIDLMNKYDDKTFECVLFGKAMSDMFISHRAAVADGKPYTVPNLTYFCYGGDFVPLEIVSYLKENLFVNATVRTGWGMTEVGIGSYCDPFVSYAHDKISVPIGQFGQNPAQFVSEIKLEDETGEIMFKLSKYSMKEYYKNPIKTSELIDSEGWVRTGDLGRIDEEEGFLYITGRKKDVIMLQEDTRIIYPIDIESMVISNIEINGYINDIAVVGCPNEVLMRNKSDKEFGLLGESPVAVITLRDSCQISTEEVVNKIYKVCEENLPPIMQLKHVFCVKAMPKGPTNKLSKTKLKQMIVDEEIKIEKPEKTL